MATSRKEITAAYRPGSLGLSQIIAWGIAAVGVLLVLWSITELGRYGLEIGSARFGVPFAIGIAGVAVGLAYGTVWQAAAVWFSVLLLGETATLQLINAGWQLRYQHYKPVADLLTYPTIAFTTVVSAQAALVLVSGRQLWRRVVGWTITRFGYWRTAILLIIFLLPTATLSENVSFYAQEWLVAGFIQLVNLATVVLFAWSLPEEEIRESLARIRAFWSRINTANGLVVNRIALVCALWVTVLAAALNVVSYEGHPHVPDEVAYLMQARFFAAGAITMPAPPVPEAFDVYLMKDEGDRWYPVTPPGWALFLAIGELVGLPLLVNAVLAGINILLAYWLIANLYSRTTAGISVLLLAASPWYIFLGMSFMTHMVTLTCALAAAVCVVRCRESGRWGWALLGGAAAGMVSLIRPLDAVAVAGLLGLWVIGLGAKRLRPMGIAMFVLGTGLVGSSGLAYNAALTGNPLSFPINLYTDEVFGHNSNAYGFGSDRGMGWALDPNPGHGPVDALINSNLNFTTMNTELFGWSIGAFLFVAVLVFVGKLNRNDLAMLAVITVVYVLHFFYYFSGGPDFAARYWFLMIIPLVALTAKGVLMLGERLKAVVKGGDIRVYASVAVLSAVALLAFVPWRAIDKYHNFRGMRPDVSRLAEDHKFGRSLVLIQGNKDPDYDSAFIYNPLDLKSDGPIFAWDRDAYTREKLLKEYSDRPVWIVRSPSITGRGFEVAAGPLTTSQLNSTGDDHGV